jgi:flagellin
MLSITSSNFSSREAVYYQQAHSNDYNETISRLASGKKINNTGDDPSIRLSIDTISKDLYANKDLYTNINNSKALLVSGSTYIDEQINDMYDVKENLTKLQSDTLTKSEKIQVKLLTRDLLDKIDGTANTAQYNGFNMLNGELKDAHFQLGINSFERLGIEIPSTRTNNLGKVRFETGSQILKEGKVDVIFKISDTEDYSLETVTIGSNKGEGIGKLAELINSSQEKIGQQAFYDVTTTGGEFIKKGSITDLIINGIRIDSIDILKDDSDNNLINSINKISEQTGIIASKDNKNRLVLNSPDGRGIELSVISGLELISIKDTNLNNYGKLTLVSTKGERSSINSPEFIGFDQTDNFIFNTRDLIKKTMPQEKISALGAFPNINTSSEDLFDVLDNKKLLNSFSFLVDNGINDLYDIKSNIDYAVTKLTETQDRIFDLNITLKNSLDNKENINYADEIYNKEKFSNLLSSSTYALTNSIKKQKDIIDELLQSIKNNHS